MSWLDVFLFGNSIQIENDGSALPIRTTIDVVPPLQAVDNSGAQKTQIGAISALTTLLALLIVDASGAQFVNTIINPTVGILPVAGTGTPGQIGTSIVYTGQGVVGGSIEGSKGGPVVIEGSPGGSGGGVLILGGTANALDKAAGEVIIRSGSFGGSPTTGSTNGDITVDADYTAGVTNRGSFIVKVRSTQMLAVDTTGILPSASVPLAWATGATVGAIRLPNPHAAYNDILLASKTNGGADMQVLGLDNTDTLSIGDGTYTQNLDLLGVAQVNIQTTGASGGVFVATQSVEIDVAGGDQAILMDELGNGVRLTSTDKVDLAAPTINLGNGSTTGIATKGRTYGADHALADSNATINVSTGSNWVLATPTANRTTRLGATGATGNDGIRFVFTRTDTAAHTWTFVDDGTSATLYTFASATPGKIWILWDDVNGRWRFDEQELTP
jgi:hypothetical protein